jgi:hypothetical protein
MDKILKKQNPWWYNLDELDRNSITRDKYLYKLKQLLETKEILTIS